MHPDPAALLASLERLLIAVALMSADADIMTGRTDVHCMHMPSRCGMCQALRESNTFDVRLKYLYKNKLQPHSGAYIRTLNIYGVMAMTCPRTA